MFRCEICGKVTSPGTSAHKVVREVRERFYSERSTANSHGGGGARKGRRRKDPGGSGHEIVREQLLCPQCAAEHSPDEP
jgi:hypothetical protein